MRDVNEAVRSARILVVDDNPVNVALLEDILDEEGYVAVTSTTDPAEALALFAQNPFDLVLLDIRMPVMDGHEVARRLRTIVGCDQPLPVIVLTAQSDQETRLRVLEAGVRDFVTKPFDRAEVLHRIRNTLEVQILWRERNDQAARLEDLVRTRTAELRAREEHLASIMRTAPDIILTVDSEGRVQEFNPAAERSFGVSAADARGRPVGQFLDGATTLRPGALEVEGRAADGTTFPVEASVASMEIDGRPWQVVIGRDVTQRKRAEAEMTFLAQHDPITELPNRSAVLCWLAARVRAGASGAVFYVAIQGLRRIADTLGHAVAEKLLREAGARLNAAAGSRALVGAWGAADFVVVCERGEGTAGHGADGRRPARALRDALEAPFAVDGSELAVDCRVGVARFPEDGASAAHLVQRAGLAVFAGRSRGDEGVTLFSGEMEEAVSRRHLLERELRRAVERGELRLLYQPKIDLNTGRVVGMEALVRWHHPHVGVVSPAQFIPVAEETGVIVGIGDWVLHEACRQLCQWHQAGHEDLVMAVNVSGRQFRVADLTDRVRGALKAAGLQPSSLELEITETAIMGDVEDAVRVLREWREMGASVAIDDFGTGYSSLGYLRQLPLSTLKIDQSFVRHLPDRDADRAVARTILDLAAALNLKVVAEGIETPAHVEVLKGLGCHLGQGYFYARPLPASDFLDYLHTYSTSTLH